MALRVLQDISIAYREPDPADVETLLTLAHDDSERAMEIDQLACTVVRRSSPLIASTPASSDVPPLLAFAATAR